MIVSKAKNRERVEIEEDHKVSRTTFHGWLSILIGLPVNGAAIFLFLIGIGKIKMNAMASHVSPWELGLGAILFLVGMALIVHGISGLKRKARMKKGKQTQPNRPWMWDYPWEPLGISENKLKRVFSALGAAAFLIAVMAPATWWVFFSDEAVSFWAKAMVVVFDIVTLWTCYDFSRKLAQYFKYGNSRLRFISFPFHLGDQLSVMLADLPREINQLCLDLRFIEEHYEYRGYGQNRSKEIVCYQLFHEARTLQGRDMASFAGKLSLEWDLPDEPEWTTTLSQRPARFWELEVKAETPGVDYHSRFLLPVYARG